MQTFPESELLKVVANKTVKWLNWQTHKTWLQIAFYTYCVVSEVLTWRFFKHRVVAPTGVREAFLWVMNTQNNLLNVMTDM